MKRLSALVFFLLLTTPCWAAHYYVSPVGNDVCFDGLDPLTPWKTIARVNQQDLQPGDIVSFEGGQTFTGTITLGANDSGTLLSPVILNSYGTGAASISAGTGNGLFAYNVTGITVSNLIFYGTSSGATSDGLKFYQDQQFGNEGITVSNVTAYNFGRYGMSVGGWVALASVGAFRHVSITDSIFHHNGSDGLNVYSQYAYANQDINFLRVTAHHNTGNGANGSGSGMVLGGTTGGSIKNSVAYENGATGTGAIGIWTYNAQNILIDTNTSHDNHSSSIDGNGFDIDVNSMNVTMQNNTSYNNDGAGYLLAQRNNNNLHTGSKLLNNTSTGDGQVRYGGLRFYGQIENATISGNAVTSSTGTTPRAAVTFNNTGIATSFPQNISFTANNFTQTGPDLINMPTAVLSGATGVSFQNNSYTASPFNIVWGATTYHSCTDWNTATGQETCVASAPAPTVTSVTPNVGAQGATITGLAIVGTNFQSGATCDFGVEITVTSCTFNSATSLTAAIMVGAQAAQGDYTVTITNPDSQSGSLLQGFTITQGPLPPPTVISTAPSTGVQGDTGDVIVIAGMDFQSGATCSFGVGITVNSCAFDSATQLTANIDIAGGATVGTRIVTVTNPDGQSDTLPAGFSVTQAAAPPPTVTSVAPTTGTQGQTLNVVITGTDFVTGATCAFGANVTTNSCTFNSSTQLTASITIDGNAATGGRTLTVTNPDAQVDSLANAFTITAAPPPAPTVTSATPNTGAQGATIGSVVIAGTGFLTGATCSFGASITVNSCTLNSSIQLTANITIAGGAATGGRTVTVTNTDAQAGSLVNGFTVTGAAPPAPTVSTATPNSGAQGATLSTVIAGTGFQSGAVVSFSGTGITVNLTTFNSATQLTVNITIAGGAATTARDVTVTNPDTQFGTGVGAFTVTVFVAPAPTVTSVTPSGGNQGATVSTALVGTGFLASPTCNFGSGITVNTCVRNSATSITSSVTIAANASSGGRTVRVTNTDGQSGTLANGFTVLVPPPAPTVTSTNPNSGAQGATLTAVVITGTNFQSGATSSFGAGITVNSTTFLSATQLRVNLTIAGGATIGTRTVTVTNPDAQFGSAAAAFSVTAVVLPAPTVTGASPASGIQGQTLIVTISGTNFQSGATCSFGSGITVNSCTFVATTQLSANITIAVAATAGARTVTVTNPDAQSGSKVGAFSVLTPTPPAPVVNSATPNSGAQSSTATIVIAGTGFQSGATSSFGAGITVNSTTFNSATQLTANITIALSATVGARTVTVTNLDGQSGSASAFTVTVFVNPAPTVSTVTPSSGVQGATIASDVIVGTGFLASPTCNYGAGITINSCTRNSATQITANITISASAAPGARTVTITNTDGQSGAKSSGFTVTGAPPPAPTVTSTSPNSGAQGATLTAVVIAGTGFQSGATCAFGAGITVNSCTFNSSLQLTANITIAGGATVGTRNVTVTNPDTQFGTGTAVFSVTAVVLPAPTLTSANPNTGAGAQTLSVILTGTNFQSGATCTFGAGVTVNGCVFNSATKLTASITIASGAAVGGRTVTVTNPDAQSASLANGFTVTGPKFARVSWIDNSNNETGFHLDRSDNDGAYGLVCTTGPNITTCDDTGIPTTTSWCYRDSAFNANGETAKAGGTGTSCHLPVVAQPPRVAIGANEGSGSTAADSSGNGLNGTWAGAWTTDSGFGNALNFTGAANKLQITGLTTYSTKRTWMLRVFLTGPGGGALGRIFDKRTNGAESEVFYYDNGNLRFLRIAATNGSWTMPAPGLNAWHTIAVSYDSGNLANVPRMWLDGVEQTVGVTAQPTGSFVNNTDPYCFGNRCGTSDRAFAGSLDEIRIFDRLITTFEVQSYMAIPLP